MLGHVTISATELDPNLSQLSIVQGDAKGRSVCEGSDPLNLKPFLNTPAVLAEFTG